MKLPTTNYGCFGSSGPHTWLLVIAWYMYLRYGSVSRGGGDIFFWIHQHHHEKVKLPHLIQKWYSDRLFPTNTHLVEFDKYYQHRDSARNVTCPWWSIFRTYWCREPRIVEQFVCSNILLCSWDTWVPWGSIPMSRPPISLVPTVLLLGMSLPTISAHYQTT